MTPEAAARQAIDSRLIEAGWIVQDMKNLNPAAGTGVAVREYPTDTGPADYILFVDKDPCGVIEAKPDKKALNLTTVEAQSTRYAKSRLKYIKDAKIRFVYEATGSLTHFTDYADEKPRAREVFSFFRPETLRTLLADSSTLRNRLKTFPDFDTEPYNKGFRACQTRAIVNLEASFAENKPRALIQMATGAGKTFTAITASYRLLKYAKAKRILFLVDTKNLGQQAEQEFLKYIPNDEKRRFGEIYGVTRLSSSLIPPDNQVCISTIQRMYAILKGEKLDDKDEETSLNEQTIGELPENPREVVYNKRYPPEYFDFIIIDECHRSIYNIWRQVLEYYDAFLIGLTATPDKRTFGFFNQNVVSEYSHEQAVIDNVNVGYDVFLINTEIGSHGATIFRQQIQTRDRLTREKRWKQLDEDFSYNAAELDRSVVNKSQIRTVLKTFREKLPELFPGRLMKNGEIEVPKTIIFAKTDSHADDIIQITREEFGESNEFCAKITYNAEHPESTLSAFRNSYFPRIAVTVDMIATGTDVKPVECLLFMRDVRSRNYFEQMKGRGTRTLNAEDLHKATPSAHGAKDHFVIIDDVGVTESLKTDSRPLERKPSISLKNLMLSVTLGDRDEDTCTSLANRLTRLAQKMNQDEYEQFTKLSGGISIHDAVQNLLDAFNPDVRNKINQKTLVEKAAAPFNNPELRNFIEETRKSYEQIIDNVNIDSVHDADWSSKVKENAAELKRTFRRFIEENKDEITALSFFYNQRWKEQALTLKMVEEVSEAMKKPPYNISPERLGWAYDSKNPLNQLADIVSIIRYELGIDKVLNPYSAIVNSNFKEWVFRENHSHQPFTEEQMEWLRLVKDFIAQNISITAADMELPRFSERGGLGRFYAVFGSRYESILQEMNLALAA
jgi:type I restriction enzyme R subunit